MGKRVEVVGSGLERVRVEVAVPEAGNDPRRIEYYGEWLGGLVEGVENGDGRVVRAALRNLSGREWLGRVTVEVKNGASWPVLTVGNARSAWMAAALVPRREAWVSKRGGWRERNVGVRLVVAWRRFMGRPVVLAALKEDLSGVEVEGRVRSLIWEVIEKASAGNLRGVDCAPNDEVGNLMGPFFRPVDE